MALNSSKLVNAIFLPLLPSPVWLCCASGGTGDSIEQIQKYERDYFAKSKLFQ